ncbi:MAG: RNA polymerase sigma factor [Anaerolineae bacterium]|uniref:RNA polymerase sigma factor n=1 Tax=Promineifilum sp. TaxID=2664178 RepID=UPI002412024D|nr:RNA polymerase sigma factor [Promineifilum sp.]MCW5847680.1 RNA polymerase sigma factor [Anaerolineae bacterium]
MTDQHLLRWNDAIMTDSAPGDETDALIARCLAGEQRAYVELYDYYSGLIYRLSYSLLGDREDAEEVLQDSFEYAFRRLDHFDARKSAFKTWLYRIAVSRCRNKRRRKWLPSFSLSAFDGDEPRDPAATPPDERALLSEQQREVWAAVSDLSPKLREVAILRYYGGLPYAEIGQVLDIPPKTAESRMRLAHKALRERLSDIVE